MCVVPVCVVFVNSFMLYLYVRFVVLMWNTSVFVCVCVCLCSPALETVTRFELTVVYRYVLCPHGIMCTVSCRQPQDGTHVWLLSLISM